MNEKIATKVIHSSYIPEEHNRALMPPIYQNSMFKMHEIGENIPFRYSRVSNPTRSILENTVADLEKGCAAFAFSSGIAAIDAIWRSILIPGDTIIVTADIYGGSYDLLTQVYQNWGINILFADLINPDHLQKLLSQKKAKLVWLETPSNPLLKILDIKQLVDIAKKYNVLVGIDNTFATPYLQNPLDYGIDFIAHSATKYLCGHSDVLMGMAVVKDKRYAELIKNIQINTGGIAGPVDCSLVLRGIKTLTIRMDRHQENAQIIAERLLNHTKISQVYYPGLTHHPQHELAKKQMRGFGGLVSIRLKTDSREEANRVIKKFQLFQMSSSLGGVESLVNHSASQSHGEMSTEVKNNLGITEGLLRLSIGIEDVEDIWHDLKQALDE
ncbi:MAG: aminotransferase class V-fold PLP-dependent enzyme [Neisseriaceae bacterium]|nr:MAG: aminotransferase class V-fold PLP-dependent enzyme [Neisseriaceae bacterium]